MKEKLCAFILKREFDRRKIKNASYSLRAFARDLGMGIATLSDVLRNKRKISKSNLEKICKKLLLTEEEKLFLWKEYANSLNKEDIERFQLSDAQMQIMSEWYHYAILEAANIKEHQATPAYLAKLLNIDRKLIRQALKRLELLGFIEIKKGKLVRKTPDVKTTNDIPSEIVRQLQGQLMEQGMRSLNADPVEKRYFYSTTIAIDPARINEAKKMMTEYSRKVSRKLENGNAKKIYALSFCLYPLSGD